MKRVLFVDDDPDLLEVLERALVRVRAECLATFALGAEPAMALLAGAPFDVVVTDYHMPRMNGADLLAHVREKYPTIVRIMVSSDADVLQTPDLSVLAHRQLVKPVDGRLLRDMLLRACELAVP